MVAQFRSANERALRQLRQDFPDIEVVHENVIE